MVKQCTCTARGCSAEQSIHPGTGATVKGRFLSPHDFRQHQLDQATWDVLHKDADRRLASESIFSATFQSSSSRPSSGFRDQNFPDAAPQGASERFSTLSDSDSRELGQIREFEVEILQRMAVWDSRPPLNPTDTLGVFQPCYPFVGHEAWFLEKKIKIKSKGSQHPATVLAREKVLDLLERQLQKMDEDREAWNAFYRDQDEENSSVTDMLSDYYNTASHFYDPFASSTPLLALMMFFVVVLNLIFRLPRSACNFCIATISMVVEQTMKTVSQDHLSKSSRLLSRLPKDVRTARRVLKLEPSYVIFAACPNCSTLFPPKPSAPGSRQFAYPSFCSALHFGNTCNSPLLITKERRGRKSQSTRRNTHRFTNDPALIGSPIRPFAYAPVKDAIAELMSRPAIEALMDEAWMAKSGSREQDIWDAEGIRSFKGPDGQLFSIKPKSEGRLIFSLSVDWFNPFRNGRGKSASFGMMSLACLNLPPDLRFKAENMHLVGVIPGPKEGDVQPFLTPLVDEFLVFWTTGVFLSRTHLYPQGRRIRAAIIPVVCDMPAARKVIGFAGQTGWTSCPYCHCTRPDIQKAALLDDPHWSPRSYDEWVRLAKAWRDAGSPNARKTHAHDHGVKWSELLRLPYWDPTQFAVVDAMHNLFLGLIQFHCRTVFGMDIEIKQESGDAERPASSSRPPVPPKPSQSIPDLLIKGRRFIEKNRPESWTALQRLNRPILDLLCRELQLDPPASNPDKCPTKREMVDEIRKWKVDPTSVNRVVRGPPPPAPPPAPKKTARIGAPTLKVIREIMMQILFPSWLGRLPANLGSKSAGTLKADQWRTAGTIVLPIALTHIWSDQPHQKPWLDNFMDLATAIQIASRRSTSFADAAEYTFYMRRYIAGLGALTPRPYLVPNHHAALHIGPFLQRLGPLHGWWSYPAERLIGALESFKTNHRLGQMELTLFRSYSEAARLRSLLQKGSCPEIVKQCWDALHRSMREEDRGTLASDMLALGVLLRPAAAAPEIAHEKTTKLNPEVYAALCRSLDLTHLKLKLSDKAQQLRSVEFKGVSFSVRDECVPNSLALVRRGGVESPVPCQIRQIFIHERALPNPDQSQRVSPRLSETFIVFSLYKPIPANTVHPFSSVHSAFGSSVWSSSLSDNLAIGRLQDIVAHFTKWEFELEGQQLMLSWSPDRT